MHRVELSVAGQHSQSLECFENTFFDCGLELAQWDYAQGGGGQARALELRLQAGRALDAPRVWLHLPGTRATEPPSVEGADGAPPAEWVGEDGVWIVTLAAVGADGDGTLHTVRWTADAPAALW